VTDVSARVEHLIGFIEPYRDPAGIRSEWEAMIGIADPDEALRLKRLVESSTTIIRQLPWAVEDVNDGKGPFEKSLFEAPDFTSVHGWQFLLPAKVSSHTNGSSSAGCMRKHRLRSRQSPQRKFIECLCGRRGN